MVTPGIVESSYRRYTHDTSLFATWLYETGIKSGYKPQRQGPKLTGRARTEARTQSSTGIYLLASMNEFLALAEAINKNKPSVIVPLEIVRAAIRAISARKLCASHYREHTNESDIVTLESNSTHCHFISVLEEVLMVLEPYFATPSPRKSATCKIISTLSKSFVELQNRFAILDVEEPTEWSQNPTLLPITSKIYVMEPPVSPTGRANEASFAVSCLLVDLNHIREHLSKIWEDCRDERVDFMTASLVTNTAFQLAQRIQAEFLEAFPECDAQDTFKSFISQLFRQMNDNDIPLEKEIFNSEPFKQFTHWPAFGYLDQFSEIFWPKNGNVRVKERGSYGKYLPIKPWSELTLTEKEFDDPALLADVLQDIALLEDCKSTVFAQDEFTRGLREMLVTRKVPVWLAFAGTVFLDIHHTLRDKASLCFEQRQTIATETHSTIQRYLSFSESINHNSPFLQDEHRRFRANSEMINTSILTDQIHATRKALVNAPDNTIPIAQKPAFLKVFSSEEHFYLLKRHPILAGLQSFSLFTNLQNCGMDLVNKMNTAIYPAYLYNAMRHLPSPVPIWPMMEQFINSEEAENLWLGAKPTTLYESHVKLCLAKGVSTISFARNTRAPLKTKSKRAPRTVTSAAPIVEIYRNMLKEDTANTTCMHDLETLLASQANPPNKSPHHKQSLSKKPLTPVQLLEKVQTSLVSSTCKSKSEIDYFLLHEKSMVFLQKLMDTMRDDFALLHGLEGLDDMDKIASVVMLILSYVCEWKDEATRAEGTHKWEILEKVSGVLEEFILEEVLGEVVGDVK